MRSWQVLGCGFCGDNGGKKVEIDEFICVVFRNEINDGKIWIFGKEKVGMFGLQGFRIIWIAACENPVSFTNAKNSF